MIICKSRKPVLVNSDLHISLAAPRKSMTDYFYKNSQADEVVFIHQGSGTLKTGFGNIKFELWRLPRDPARHHLPNGV